MTFATDLPRNRQGRAEAKGTKVWIKDLPQGVMQESVWERQMMLSGMEAYENSRSDNLSENAGGQKLLRNHIVTASAAIEKAQLSALDQSKTDRSQRGTTMMVPADTSALFTLKALLDKCYACADRTVGVVYQQVCKDVSKSVETELNFRTWLQSSKANAVEFAKASGQTVRPSMAEMLIKNEVEGHGRGRIGRATLHRWKNTFEELRTYEWDNLAHHYCGEFLVLTVIEALPEVFERHLVFRNGSNTYHVRLTEAAIEQLERTEALKAQQQVYRKPMLSRPKRWVGTAE